MQPSVCPRPPYSVSEAGDDVADLRVLHRCLGSADQAALRLAHFAPWWFLANAGRISRSSGVVDRICMNGRQDLDKRAGRHG